MHMTFSDAIIKRRSIYTLTKFIGITDKRLYELLEQALLHTPSPFHAQNARLILLLNKHHDRLWEIVEETLHNYIPKEIFTTTKEKISSFSAGYGTILYFEDTEIITKLQKTYPIYNDHFPIWSNQSNGMLQYIIWTSLATEDIGASLQHYNPLIDKAVHSEWNIPKSWHLLAQMPFGKSDAPATPKTFAPLAPRLRVLS